MKDFSFIKIPLSSEEKILKKIFSSKSSLVLWQKGSRARFHCESRSSFVKGVRINISCPKGAPPPGDVFVNFTFEGHSFFIKGQLKQNSGTERFELGLNSPLYRCEKRGAFRLKVPKNKKAFISIPVDQLQEDRSIINNIIPIQKGIDQMENYFSLFMDYINPDKDDSEKNTGLQSNPLQGKKEKKEKQFKVRDISVKGISFIIDDFERTFFSTGKVYKDLVFLLDDKEFKVGELLAIHCGKDCDRHLDGGEQLYIGGEISKISSNMESLLSQKINSIIQELGREAFETID